ncbi:MAG: hypothetical protein ACOH2J_18250 [Allorhizobium sp.]
MTCDPFKPSIYIEGTRASLQSLLVPGRIVTDIVVARLTAEINTSLEIAREFEDEMLVLQSMLMPQRVDPSPLYSTGQVIPLRRRPVLRIVGGTSEEGGAA